MRPLALFLLGSAAAFAQVQVLLVDAPGSEKPVSTVYQVGATAVGDRMDTVFRVRNTSQASLTIRTLTLGGSGFSMFGQPSLPHTLAPGLNMDFTVRFSPRDYGSYSANLNVNGTALLLLGSSTAVPVLSVGGTQLPSGSAVDLGLAERGTTLSKTFRLENTTSERVRATAIIITGKHFRLGQVPSLPLELPPQSSIDFEVVFAPTASGVFEGALAIDGRTYRLTGAANEPAFPKPTVIIDLPSPVSGQQGRVSVQFGQESRAIGSGKMRMEFRPSSVVAMDDEAVRFVRGNRSLNFDVTEGMKTPVSELTFQTGTTAGTIVFIAEVGGWTATASVDIGRDRVHIDKTRLVKNGSLLELEITGYDNTRSVGQLSFTFYTAKGEVVPPGAIRIDSNADFRRYFESTTAGGGFTLKAVFPVAGSISGIASVDVEVANVSGSALSGKAPVQ